MTDAALLDALADMLDGKTTDSPTEHTAARLRDLATRLPELERAKERDDYEHPEFEHEPWPENVSLNKDNFWVYTTKEGQTILIGKATSE
jgi:hypothetical protein